MDRSVRLLGVGQAIRAFGNALYFPFLAIFLHAELHVGFLAIGLIILGVGLVQLPFSGVGGLLADRIGRRPLILMGVAAEAAATAGLALAFSQGSLLGAIAAALAGGILSSASGPAFSAYITDFVEGPERTRGFTFYRVGFNAGFAAGVASGGLLVTFLSFPGTAAVATGIELVGVVLLALLLPPSAYDLRLRSGDRSLRAGDPGPVADRAPGGIGASLRLLARDRAAIEVAIAFTLAALVVGQWSVTFPLFVSNVLGIPYALLGVGLALNGVIVVLGQTATTEGVIGWRHTRLAIAGTLLYVVAFLGLAAAGAFAIVPIVAFFVAVVVLTVGENLLSIPQSVLPSNLAPANEVGWYNGAFQMLGGVGFLASVTIGGGVLQLGLPPLTTWLLLTLPALPAVLLLRHAAGRLRPEVDRA